MTTFTHLKAMALSAICLLFITMMSSSMMPVAHATVAAAAQDLGPHMPVMKTIITKKSPETVYAWPSSSSSPSPSPTSSTSPTTSGTPTTTTDPSSSPSPSSTTAPPANTGSSSTSRAGSYGGSYNNNNNNFNNHRGPGRNGSYLTWPALNYTYFVPSASSGTLAIFAQSQIDLLNSQYGYIPAVNDTLTNRTANSSIKSQGYGTISYGGSGSYNSVWASMKRQPADGTALALIVMPQFLVQAYNSNQNPSTSYRANDITLVYIHSYTPVAAVVSADNNKINSWADFVALCQASPGQVLTAGTGGSLSIGRIAALSIMKLAGISFNYDSTIGGNSGGSVESALLNGTITLSWSLTSSVYNDPRYKILAVAGAIGDIANVTTFRELGIDYVDGSYRGFGVPSATCKSTASTDTCSQISESIDRLRWMSSGSSGGGGRGGRGGSSSNNSSNTGLLPSGYALAQLQYGPTIQNWMVLKNFSYQATLFPPPPPPQVLVPVVTEASYAMLSLGGIGLVMTGMGTFSLFYYREHPVFIAASKPFCLVMLLGFFLGYTSMILLSLDPSIGISNSSHTNICRTFPFVFGFSFNLLFGALFAKTYRLVTIFYNKALMMSKNITNWAIAKNVTILLVTEAIFHLIWLVTSPLESRPLTIDSTHYTISCQGDHLWIFLAIMIASKVVLLLFGIALAIKTRDVESQFNESKMIGFCLYNIFFTALVAIPLISLLWTFVTLQYIIMNVALWLCLSICLIALFIPKIITARNTDPNTYRRKQPSSNLKKGTGMNTNNTHYQFKDSSNNTTDGIRHGGSSGSSRGSSQNNSKNSSINLIQTNERYGTLRNHVMAPTIRTLSNGTSSELVSSFNMSDISSGTSGVQAIQNPHAYAPSANINSQMNVYGENSTESSMGLGLVSVELGPIPVASTHTPNVAGSATTYDPTQTVAVEGEGGVMQNEGPGAVDPVPVTQV